MNNVRDLLALKGGDIWALAPEETVYNALVLMSDKDIGSVLVVEEGRLIGIITEKDYVRKVLLRGKTSKNTPIRAAMSAPVYTVNLYSSIRDCMEIMSRRQIRHLPVMDEGRVVGVISISDVMREIIYAQGERIRFWEDLSIEL